MPLYSISSCIVTRYSSLNARHRGQIINYEGDLPKEVSIEDKSVAERMKLIDQLEDEDKQAVFRIIDGMLTKAKFKDFFQQQLAQ